MKKAIPKKESLKQIFKKGSRLSVNGSLWVESSGQRFWGPGPVELLEHIAESGSINRAAKEMGMSYQKAWGIVRALNANTSRPVVIIQTGGEKGGGSKITEEALELIRYHQLLRKRFEAFLKKESERLNR